MAETIIKINLGKYCIAGEAILVIDTVESTAPAKGGVRVHPFVTEEEISALAAEMSRKCILAGLPFGGAKGGIRLSRMDQVEKAMYAFGRELSKLELLPYKWCAAPDVNTDSKSIDAFVAGCASVKGWRKARLAATGKSTGIPHELGSTAYGVVRSIEETIKNLEISPEIKNAGVIVEGIGEVGGNAVKILAQKGAKILGVSDITGAIYDKKGLDSVTLCDLIEKKAIVRNFSVSFPNAEFNADSSTLLNREADILVLAGPGRSITEKNADKLKVKLICEGANIAYSDNNLRNIVTSNGIISIPGIIANSGGVISSYVEWLLENENAIDYPVEAKWERVKKEIELRIPSNILALCEKIKENKFDNTYECALELADEYMQKRKKANRELRNKSKKINSELEKKFCVFTR